MAKLATAANIAETHADGFLKKRVKLPASPRCKTTAVHRGRSSKRPVESIEETHLNGYLCKGGGGKFALECQASERAYSVRQDSPSWLSK